METTPNIDENKEFEYEYDDKKINWKIKLYKKKTNIIIEVYDTVISLEIYKNTFTLSSLYEKDEIFKKVKTIDTAFSFLVYYFDNKKFSLIKNDNNNTLVIQLKYNIDFFGENLIEFQLTKIEVDSD